MFWPIIIGQLIVTATPPPYRGPGALRLFEGAWSALVHHIAWLSARSRPALPATSHAVVTIASAIGHQSQGPGVTAIACMTDTLAMVPRSSAIVGGVWGPGPGSTRSWCRCLCHIAPHDLHPMCTLPCTHVEHRYVIHDLHHMTFGLTLCFRLLIRP